jgi:drug/metabolite transporter (DMT)-like permease
VILAMSGSYLLCGGLGSINRGEWFVIACAVIYSVHIMVIDRYAANCDCVRLSCLQFMVAAVLSAAGSLILREVWELDGIVSSLPFWMFCGVGSSAVAFTLQMVAQKYLHPVTATLLMSLESVFAVLGGWLFLREMLSIRELAGCGVIFCAIILSQLPIGRKKA